MNYKNKFRKAGDKVGARARVKMGVIGSKTSLEIDIQKDANKVKKELLLLIRVLGGVPASLLLLKQMGGRLTDREF